MKPIFMLDSLLDIVDRKSIAAELKQRQIGLRGPRASIKQAIFRRYSSCQERELLTLWTAHGILSAF